MTTLYFYWLRLWNGARRWAEKRADAAAKKYNEGWRL